ILRRYRQAVSAAGWRLPAERDLNVLFETAEYARFATRVAWAAMAWLHDGAEWVPVELAEIARWFEAWRPVLAEANRRPMKDITNHKRVLVTGGAGLLGSHGGGRLVADGCAR